MAALVGTLLFPGALGIPAEAGEGETLAGQPPGPADPDPSWQADGTLSGQRYSYAYPAYGVSTDGLLLDLQMVLTKFAAPLVDDGGPYTLAPFLQRRSDWWVSFDGSHFVTHNPFGGEDRTDWSGDFAGGVNVYVKRWLAVTGGAGYGLHALHDVGVDQKDHSLYGSAGLGLRGGDTRLDLWYSVLSVYVAGSFAPLRQSAGASAFTVLARRVSANLSGSLMAGGMEGGLSVEFFPTRELGIFAGGLVEKGELYNVSQVQTRQVGRIGLTGWFDARMALTGEYELTLENLPVRPYGSSWEGYHKIAHTLLFAAQTRFDDL